MVVAIIVTAVVVLVVGIVVVVVVEVVAVVDVAVIFCLRLFGTNNYQKVKFLSRNRNREPSLEPAREVVIVRLKVDSDGKSYSESFIATETHEPVCQFCATRNVFFSNKCKFLSRTMNHLSQRQTRNLLEQKKPELQKNSSDCWADAFLVSSRSCFALGCIFRRLSFPKKDFPAGSHQSSRAQSFWNNCSELWNEVLVMQLLKPSLKVELRRRNLY